MYREKICRRKEGGIKMKKVPARETQPLKSSEINLDLEYKYGFITNIESDVAPRGLNEDIIRFISAKKKEPPFLLEWRLKAYRHWQTMKEPQWPNLHYDKINYQDIIY